MRSWDKLPDYIRIEEVRPYYDLLKRKWFYRFIKRTFDLFASFILLALLFFPSFIIGVVICSTSKGGPFFFQKRVGRYGKIFRIIKFRTMKKNSEGNQHITHKNDSRITGVGKFLRKTHLDEFPQLLNVIVGQMSFVGTRPEVKQFVDKYQNEWFATLLMRPGITSIASCTYEDESIFMPYENANEVYIDGILPCKMKLNLNDLKKTNAFYDLYICLKTIF